MRVPLKCLSPASKSKTLLLGTGILLVLSAPAFAQGNDILLPAADAPPIVDDAGAAPPDPSALTAPVDPNASAQAEDAMDDLLKKIDQGAAQVQEPPPTVPEIAPPVVPATPPTDAALTPPAEAPVVTPTETLPVIVPPPAGSAPNPATTPPATAGVPGTAPPSAVNDVPIIPALPPDTNPEENLFFDADNLVPTGEMGANAPRKVNPALQPASKLIVVKKDYEPSSRQAQLVSAQRAIDLGRYDSALELYNQLYQKNNRDPNILMGRAVALQHLGQDEEAILAYEELLDIRPDNVQAQVNMLGLMGQRYPAVGLQRLLELRNKQPENVAIVGQIAVLQAGLGQYDEAFKYLGIAASMEPHNANHLYNMAVVADRAGKKDDAIKFYEEALEVDSIYGGNRSIPRDAVFERLARLR